MYKDLNGKWHCTPEEKRKAGWRRGLTKETDERIKRHSETMKGIVTWNKGLTKDTDSRIKKMSEKQKGHIPWNKNQTNVYSTKTLNRMSEMKKGRTGEKASNWQGGLTSFSKRIRNSLKFCQWRSDVFIRDDFTCQKCGKRGCFLNAHHLVAFSDIMRLNDIQILEQAMNCEELWNINNGMTLCEECHNLTKNGNPRKSKIIKEKLWA